MRGNDGWCWRDEGFASEDSVADCHRAEMPVRLVILLVIEAGQVCSPRSEEDIVTYGDPGGTAGVTVALR